MNKLLVLVLVLGMASLVNAAPLFTATATAPFEIKITFTDPVPEQFLDVFIDYTPLKAAGLNFNAATLTSINADIANLFVYTVAMDGYDVYFLAMGNLTNWTNPTEIAVLDLNGTGANVGTTPLVLDVYDMEGDFSGTVTVTVLGTVTILIPEPGTIMLLCVGGLLLRRKK